MRCHKLSLVVGAVVALGWSAAPVRAQQLPEPEPVVRAGPPAYTALPAMSPAVLRDRRDEPVESGGHQVLPRSIKGPAGAGGSWSVRSVTPLAGVLVLIVMLTFVVRRFFLKSPLAGSTTIQVLGKTYLSPKQSLALVRVGRRIMMLGITPDHISQLVTIDDPSEIDVLAAGTTTGRAAHHDRFATALDEESDLYPPDGLEGRLDEESDLYRPDGLEGRLDEVDLNVQHTRRGLQDLLGRLKSIGETARTS